MAHRTQIHEAGRGKHKHVHLHGLKCDTVGIPGEMYKSEHGGSTVKHNSRRVCCVYTALMLL